MSQVQLGLLCRSPYHCNGDEERDMDKRVPTQSTTAKNPTWRNNDGDRPSVHPTVGGLKTRGPHYSGTQNQRMSTSSSSGLSSLSESGMAYRQNTGMASPSTTRLPQGTADHTDRQRQEDPRFTHVTGLVGQHPYPGEMIANYHAGPHTDHYTRETFTSHQNFVQPQYGMQGRPSEPRFYPSTPAHYIDSDVVSQGFTYAPAYGPSHDIEYGHGMYRRIPVSSHLQNPTQPRQALYEHRTASQHSSLARTRSTDSFGEGRPYYDVDSSSQRGYSSLGDVPNRVTMPTPVYPPHPLYKRENGSHVYQMSHPDFSSTVAQYDPSSCRSDNTLFPNSGYPQGLGNVDTLVENTAHISLNADESFIDIIEHPKDVSIDPLQRAVFTCRAKVRGEDQANILWIKDGEPLIGEIDSDYVIEEATEKDEGVYHCLVSHPTNGAEQKESRPAKLVVKKPEDEVQLPKEKLPRVVRQPTGVVIAVVDDTLELELEASGEEPLRYQWYKNGTDLKFGQSAVLKYPVARPENSGVYSCSVANDHGSILCVPFTVEVTRVRANPQDLSDSFLQTVSKVIAHQVRSSDELACVLGLGNTDVTTFRRLDEQVLQLLRIWTQRENGDKMKLQKVLNRAKILLDVERIPRPKHASPAATPQIALHPESREVFYGQRVQLHIQASSPTSSTRYQWYFNHKPLASQTSPRLAINSVVESDEGEYVCVVSDGGHTVMSRPAVIKIFCQDYQAHHFYMPVDRIQQPSIFDSRQAMNQRHELDNLLGRGGQTVNASYKSSNEQRASGRGTEQGAPKDQVGKSGQVLTQSPSIIQHPSSMDVEPGDRLTLTCKAVSDGQLRYSWFFNGLLIKEEDSFEYFLNCFTDEDEGFYSCRVSNEHGAVMSNIAHVKLKLDSD